MKLSLLWGHVVPTMFAHLSNCTAMYFSRLHPAGSWGGGGWCSSNCLGLHTMFTRLSSNVPFTLQGSCGGGGWCSLNCWGAPGLYIIMSLLWSVWLQAAYALAATAILVESCPCCAGDTRGGGACTAVKAKVWLCRRYGRAVSTAVRCGRTRKR